MNYIRLVCILLVFLSISACSRVHYGIKSRYDFSKIKSVAVAGIKDYPEFKGSGEIVSGEVILGLIKRGYNVIERSKLKTLLEEHKLALGGVLDTTAIRNIGKITGVDTIITGSIINYSTKRFFEVPIEISERGGERLSFYYDPKKKSTIPIKIREADKKSRTVEIRTIDSSVGINLRMIDVESGSIIWAGSYSYNSLDISHAIAQVLDKILNTLNVSNP